MSDALAGRVPDAARQAVVQHPRDPGPRRESPSSSPRRPTRRCAPKPTTKSMKKAVSTLFQPLLSHDCTTGIRGVSRSRRAATTSTSPATWPSPSPSNEPSDTSPWGAAGLRRYSLTNYCQTVRAAETAMHFSRSGIRWGSWLSASNSARSVHLRSHTKRQLAPLLAEHPGDHLDWRRSTRYSLRISAQWSKFRFQTDADTTIGHSRRDRFRRPDC